MLTALILFIAAPAASAKPYPNGCITSATSNICHTGSPSIVSASGGYLALGVDSAGAVYEAQGTNEANELPGLGGMRLKAPIVGIAAAPLDRGYWLVGVDGGVFAVDVPFYGSLGGVGLLAPIVAIASTPVGGGYWLVGSDGGVFAYGAAHFYGSLGGVKLAARIASITPTPDGRGYWLVGSDGGVFGFGDAHFYGSVATARLDSPVVAMATDLEGDGYWLVGQDGGIFALGQVPFRDSFVGLFRSPVIAASDDDYLDISPTGPGERAHTLYKGYCAAAMSGQVYCDNGYFNP